MHRTGRASNLFSTNTYTRTVQELVHVKRYNFLSGPPRFCFSAGAYMENC